MILAGGYLAFDEHVFNWPENPPSERLGFGADGDAVYLLSADAAGNLTGYMHGFAFGAADPNVSFGRYLTSEGKEHFVAQSTNTLGTTNALPRVGPVVIAEIMYHPFGTLAGANLSQDTAGGYIELQNLTDEPVALFSAMLFVANIRDLPSLAAKLRQPTNNVSQFLWDKLSAATQGQVDDYLLARTEPQRLGEALVAELNRVIVGPAIYETQRFAGVPLSPETTLLLGQSPQGEMRARLHRLLLTDAYPQELSKACVASNSWRLAGDVEYVFPTNTWVAPRSRVVIVDFDPQGDLEALADFRTRFGVAEDVVMMGPYGGQLRDRARPLSWESLSPPRK